MDRLRLERSKAFYTEVLGFEVAMDTLPPEDDEFYGILAENLQGGITELVPFGIALLPFRDPDGIQLEICAPL